MTQVSPTCNSSYNFHNFLPAFFFQICTDASFGWFFGWNIYFAFCKGKTCKSQQANDGFFIFGPPCWRCHDLQRTVRHFFLRFLFERFAGPDCCQSACARLRIKLWILSFLGNTKKHKNNTYAFPTTGPLRIENIYAFPSFFGGLIGNTHAFSRLFGKHISKN